MPKRSTLEDEEGYGVLKSTATGMLHLSALDRVCGEGVKPVDPRLLVSRNNWGTELWTDGEVKQALVHGVSDGLSINKALDNLGKTFGLMPSRSVIERWKREDPQFDEDLKIALSIRGEVMAEAALEVVMSATDRESAAVAKVKAAHLQWHASKIAPKAYADKKPEEQSEPIKSLSDEELDARIRALMANENLKKHIGVIVEDAVVVEGGHAGVSTHASGDSDAKAEKPETGNGRVAIVGSAMSMRANSGAGQEVVSDASRPGLDQASQ